MNARKWIYPYTALMLVGALWAAGRERAEPILLYNPTDSAPIGWYKINKSEPIAVGDLVASYLPEDAAQLAASRGYLPHNLPIIKTVGGIAGERYCMQDGRLTIAQRHRLVPLLTDSQGRDMPALPEGCAEIASDHVLLISKRVKHSFDSRYFGQVSMSYVLGRVDYLGDDRSDDGLDKTVMGGARGSGAEGKIKAASANGALWPCLHITFYSADFGKAAPCFWNSSMNTAGSHSANAQKRMGPHGNSDPW